MPVRPRILANACAALTLSALAGCAAGPDFRSPHGDTPAASLPQDWWTMFDCAALNTLVDRALAANPDLERAQARLREAAADVQAQTGATAWPAVNATVSGSRQRIDTAAYGFVASPSPPPFNLYNASVNASYMLDIFGANRRVVEALRAQVDYQRYEYEASRLTLAANVVTAAVRRASLDAEIAAEMQLLDTLKRQTEIIRRRYALGGVSELELRNQQMALARAQSDLPILDQQRAQLSHQLAAYLGQAPEDSGAPAVDFDALRLPTELPVTLSSTLARRRPDVRAAEALWHAANADVGVATANLYPKLTLTASAGSIATNSGDLANAFNVWSIGAQLMQPIFRGGELRAKKRSARAAYAAAGATYRLTVLQALQQVADGLSALDADASKLLARSNAAAQAQAALSITEREYAAGGVSEQVLLDARRQSLLTRIDRIGAQADRYVDTAGLLHALGGGYDAP